MQAFGIVSQPHADGVIAVVVVRMNSTKNSHQIVADTPSVCV